MLDQRIRRYNLIMALSMFEQKLLEVETELEKLRSIYEQYFSGVQKREPIREHQNFRNKLERIHLAELKTTATRFRFQSVQSRYTQLNQLWSKILRQIEEGTYRRDLFILEHKTEKPSNASANTSRPSPSELNYSDLYDQVKTIMSGAEKIPDREKFVRTIQKHLELQKAKNPGKILDVRVEKQDAGGFQIKIRAR